MSEAIACGANLDREVVSDESLQEAHAHLLRNRPEPKEGYPPIPVLLVFLFGGLFFFAAIYAANNSGGFGALAYDPGSWPGLSDIAPVQVDLVTVGRRLYTSNCAICHQESGTGAPSAIPPLIGAEWVLGSEDVLIGITLHGLVGPITVLGQRYDGAMPGFGAIWSDTDVAAVASYIRQAWGNAAPPVSPDSVATVRRSTAGRSAPLTAPEARALGGN